MREILDIFEVIEKYRMIEAGAGVVAGVSGGADSVCLLYILCEYRKKVPFALTVVHVEHGLRGEASLKDAEFTKKLCRELRVPCRVVTAQVREAADKKGLSLEEAGRMERYRIFEEVRKECGAECIAVAHNRNDQAETVLWNLVRGSGLKGLGGIMPVRGAVIRPLLFTGRETIERILREAKIPWRTDGTNLEQEYTRNRIRLSVLPQMERELNRRSTEHIAMAAEKLQKVQAYVAHMADLAAEKALYRDGQSVCINLTEYFKEEELIRQELLRKALEMYGNGNGLKDIGSVHLEALERLAGMECGKKTCLPGRVRAVRENGILRLAEDPPKSRGTKRLEMAGKGRSTGKHAAPGQSRMDELEITKAGCYHMGGWRIQVEILENGPSLQKQFMEEKKYTKWLSYDTIKSNVRFRTRRTGDYLIVNRQGGHKKLKDYLIDLKIPRDQRDQIWMFADGAHVLWVPGYRISEAAKVESGTKKVMRICAEEEGKCAAFVKMPSDELPPNESEGALHTDKEEGK